MVCCSGNYFEIQSSGSDEAEQKLRCFQGRNCSVALACKDELLTQHLQCKDKPELWSATKNIIWRRSSHVVERRNDSIISSPGQPHLVVLWSGVENDSIIIIITILVTSSQEVSENMMSRVLVSLS